MSTVAADGSADSVTTFFDGWNPTEVR